ncbi:MAG: hypothetical protein M3431_06490 [Actinomycetota bacterium]|nr:hypothetical protein [Actinomycetota bacterium]
MTSFPDSHHDLLTSTGVAVLATIGPIDPANPFRTLEIRAHAVVAPDDGYDLADRVGAKYGADLRHMDQPGDRRYAVRLEPLRVRATP